MIDPVLIHAISGPIFHQIYENAINPYAQQFVQYTTETLKSIGELAAGSSTLALFSTTITYPISDTAWALLYGSTPILSSLTYLLDPVTFAGHALCGDTDLHLERLIGLKRNITVVLKKLLLFTQRKYCVLRNIFDG